MTHCPLYTLFITIIITNVLGLGLAHIKGNPADVHHHDDDSNMQQGMLSTASIV